MPGAILVGHGMVAGLHVRALRDAGIQIAAVIGRDAARARHFVAEHAPGTWATDDLGAAAADADFAIIVTPPDARDSAMRTLVDARCPILAEKPVERTLAAARALVALCEDATLPFGVIFQHRAREASCEALALVASGALGPLHLVRIDVPWWRDQAYYDTPGRGTYARDGGGVMINQAIHTLDLALALAGPVAEVRALTATSAAHRMEAEDVVAGGLTFESGAVGTLSATVAAFPGAAEWIELHGREGSARLEAGVLTIRWRDGQTETRGAAAGTGGGADPMAFTSDWHRDVVADFAAALAEGRPPMVPGRTALRVHALIDALQTSGRTGRPATVESA